MKQRENGRKGGLERVCCRVTDTQRVKERERDADAKEERAFFSCFSLGFSSSFPTRREACSAEATVQNLTGILHVCLSVCVCVLSKMKGLDGLSWKLIRIKTIIPAERLCTDICSRLTQTHTHTLQSNTSDTSG